MTFDSLQFALFLAAVFVIYYQPWMRRTGRQNILVLAASYLFYGAWDWRFLSLIIFTSVSTWGCALAMDRRRSRGRLFAGLNIAVSLGILFAFKYFNFFGENLTRLFELMGWSFDWVFIDVLLPVGISFYTFQAIGYTVDVYRRDVEPVRSPLLFATFIAYFPQLVAGPIESASRLVPQLAAVRNWNAADAVEGLRRVLWGLVKKIAVADQCSFYVDKFWAEGIDGPLGRIRIFVAVLLFTVQIYCDFSGYCDIALGSSRMLGIKLMENFRRPYFSRSVTEFWRRWHISLTRWFTTYVYIPLGGSRVSRQRTYANIFIVFFLSGLWHGASWCFVLWGVYWGVVYIIARMVGVSDHRDSVATLSRRDSYCMIATMALAVIGWGIFRSRTEAQCVDYLIHSIVPLTAVAAAVALLLCRLVRPKAIAVAGLLLTAASVVALPALFGARAVAWLFVAVAVMVFACEWLTRRCEFRMFPLPGSRLWRHALYIVLYLIILLAPAVDAQFIYFQF